jgi:hypothetical protein
MNCNPRPLGFVWAGPLKEEAINASTHRRAEIVAELRSIALGLLWFQQNDPDVPIADRVESRRFGLCADEFVYNGHFPTQLYA